MSERALNTYEDGGQKEEHGSRMRPDLISPHFLERLGYRLEFGTRKYSERNWERGIPSSALFASLKRHLVQWMQGQDDEDHLGAVAFHLMALIHNEEAVKKGLLSDKYLDLPWYEKGVVDATADQENGR